MFGADLQLYLCLSMVQRCQPKRIFPNKFARFTFKMANPSNPRIPRIPLSRRSEVYAPSNFRLISSLIAKMLIPSLASYVPDWPFSFRILAPPA